MSLSLSIANHCICKVFALLVFSQCLLAQSLGQSSDDDLETSPGVTVFVLASEGVVAESVDDDSQVTIPHDKSLRIYETAPNRYIVYYEGKQVYVLQDDVKLLPDALAEVEKRLADDPRSVELLALKTRLLYLLRKTDACVKASDAVLEIEPEHVQTLQQRCSSFFFLGETQQMTETLRVLEKIAPDHYRTHANRFYLDQQIGRHDDALESIKKALELEPYQTALWSNMGLQKMIMGLADEADEAWQKAIEVDPAFAGAHYFIGHYATQDGDIEKAKKHYREFARLNGDNVTPYRSLAVDAAQENDGDSLRRYLIRLSNCSDATKHDRYESGWELATSDIAGAVDGQQALRIANELIESETEPDFVSRNLLLKVAALLRLEKFKEASDTLELVSPDSRFEQYRVLKDSADKERPFETPSSFR